ncbi:hypothetical protein E4U21_001920 [Claviceps maximensis]|nr:hypothetical protein E4U21_001920 [Claviceps maximensis]
MDVERYQLLNGFTTEEGFFSYDPGGYHPVCLGDTFKDNRYRVIHKLGWGGHATVWLARDTVFKIWVALKIERAETTMPSRELLNHQSIHLHTECNSLALLMDFFVHDGPNGSHPCTVMEFLGPTISRVVNDYQNGGDRLDAQIIFRVTKQLLEAVRDLHEAGYAHGDLSVRNVVFACSGLSRHSEDALLDVIGRPEIATAIRTDGGQMSDNLPKQMVETTDWEKWIEEDKEDIRLIDWGQAFKHGEEPARLAQPRDLQAPEILLAGTFDYRVDLWRAGCVIYYLLFARQPFSYSGKEIGLLESMIGLVGELPQQWQAAWETMRRKSLYCATKFDRKDKYDAFELQSRFDRLVNDPELLPLLPIISGLMRFLPCTRLSAAEALELLP